MEGDDGSFVEKLSPTGESNADQRVFVGGYQHPIWVGTRMEKSELFTLDFEAIYNVWSKVHLGWGWPDGKPWGEQDSELVSLVEQMEWIHVNHFSFDRKAAKAAMETAAYTKVTAQGKRIK
jgi:hypothetical protein